MCHSQTKATNLLTLARCSCVRLRDAQTKNKDTSTLPRVARTRLFGGAQGSSLRAIHNRARPCIVVQEPQTKLLGGAALLPTQRPPATWQTKRYNEACKNNHLGKKPRSRKQPRAIHNRATSCIARDSSCVSQCSAGTTDAPARPESSSGV